MLILYEIGPENDFLDKNQFLENDLKISFFSPRNVDSLRDKAKKVIYSRSSQNILQFPEILIVYE